MKKQKLLVTIFTLLVIVVGVSFAFFLIGATITGEGASTRGETADLIDVTYLKGEKVEGTLYPGKSITKEVKVKLNPGKDDLNKEATYAIFMDIEQNGFKKCTEDLRTDTNQCELNAKELTYAIKEGENDDITPDDNDLTGKNGAVRLAKVTKTNIESEVTYTYTITITFNETNADQNHNNDATFSGSIRVEFADEKDLSPSEQTLVNLYLEDASQGEATSFDKTACGGDCDIEENGLFEAQDGENKSYYFRGTVNNNWVSFAGYYWRIIRINGDGSIRLIYNGETTNQKDASTNAVAKQRFAVKDYDLYDDAKYEGFMYGPTNVSSDSTTASKNYNEATDNSTPSNVKNQLDNWYTANLMNKPAGSGNKIAKDYIDIEAGFCGDRTVYTGTSADTKDVNEVSSGYGNQKTYYGTNIRLATNRTPTFDCEKSNDLYTVSSAKKGNHALTNPIGLITADEASFAGGKHGNANSGYWLITGENYWTMSPSYFSGSYAYVFCVSYDGNIGHPSVNGMAGVRPVINLKADTTFTFKDAAQPKGTPTNPYEVS